MSGCSRFVWNKALGLQKDRLARGERLLSYGDLACLLKLWKQSDEYGFLKDAHSQALQQTLKDLDRALWDCLKKTGKRFPRFKSKNRADDRFRYPQGFRFDNRRVYLPKLGWVGFFKSRAITGTAKNVTVSRRGARWYIAVQVEQETAAPKHPGDGIIGIDLGVARFATLSDGTVIPAIHAGKRLQKRLALEQRRLSRKQKKSSNWYKQKSRVTRIHEKIADIRKDYLHQASTQLSKNHAVVVLENLQVANMSASAAGTVEEPGRNVKAKSGLNRSILDQGWYEFRRQLTYKQCWLGGEVVLVDPKHTSQRCSGCGHVASENRKTRDAFTCVSCGHSENADVNAARNILAAGQAVIACGAASLDTAVKQEPTGTREQVPSLAA
jgi:putative transposase